MLDSFTTHMEANFSFLKEKKLLVAVSGGVDSMVLVNLLYKRSLNLTLAHCNFKLRDAESDADEAFVVYAATQLHIPIEVETFDTKAYAEKKGLNIQLAARELRYGWFNQLCDTKGYDCIVVAHHANDKLETFLINLSRGTGLEGLKGIPEINERVVRPLLPFSREEILTYAKFNEISWREDSSNSSDKYIRNKIRHHITPVLEELHPNFLSNFLTTQHYLQDTSVMLEQYITKLKAELFVRKGEVIEISIEALKKLNPLSTYIYELFKAYNFTAWSDIIALLDAQSGKKIISSTHELSNHRAVLVLRSVTNVTTELFHINEIPFSIENPLTVFSEVVSEIGEINTNIIYVDQEKLNLPLVVRKRGNGDYFYPFGMRGKKLISKFYKDQKLSVPEKDAQWLLCANNEIVWIIGRRADNRFAVSDQTKHILKIQWVTQ